MFYKIKPVPTAEEVKAHLPLSDGLKQRRLEFVTQTENILSGIDKRKLIIVGPCSADSESPVCEYAENLARVAQKIKSVAHVIMRVYTGKPRTRGDGYTGMIHTPDPKSGITDINSGLVAARKLHIKVAETSGLFTADEMLYPNAVEYTDDIVSYLTIGARSAQDPLHRYVASGLDFPIGVKNPIHGNVGDLVDSLYSVGKPNEFLFNDCQTRTSGNKFAHAVLRGAVDINGKNVPNYGYEYVMRLY
ncbi:MAG: 3-deoxy-7-phosphoheptulonate synthase [Clostridiales bacterium]|nr:3-deoxy-7-phosphoheptulonate synthase [Clostridiales bacterium]